MLTPRTSLAPIDNLNNHFLFVVAIFLFCFAPATAQELSPCAPRPMISQAPPLAAESFQLASEAEVGLEIRARSPGASWAVKGAEAAAIVIEVDGRYNQDLLLWGGDKPFTYRVMLGRFPRGRHAVSVRLNPARSAAGAKRAEVVGLRPLPFPARDTKTVDEDALAHAFAPILFARPNTIDRFSDVPLLMYYEVMREPAGDSIIRYTTIFSHEDGGTATAALMARWGRATDIEWAYELRVRGGKIIEETFQGVEHETKFFTGARTMGDHPLLAVASDNNNFSDLACSAVRYAPLPTRARLDAATRESVMDAEPWTHRVMSEELQRERRITDRAFSANTIADPRHYLYIEASAELTGAALAFDVQLNGDTQFYPSDLNDARLRIDRSVPFRSAVRLPAGTTPSKVEKIAVRCHETAQAAGRRACRRVRLGKVLMLDREYVPRPLKQFSGPPELHLAPGEAATFDRAGKDK
ncbi:MAG TPA: hypothetical protein VM943_04120 [Pyrinomonadaceae bacterium]|nr:hypothetical protein [Pyrinomonadaceae bacterium]